MTDLAVQQQKKLDALARDIDRQIDALWAELMPRGMQLGLLIEKLRESESWTRLGFASENAYRASKRIGRSTWYRMGRIRSLVSKLPAMDFLRLTAENAEQLGRLDEKNRYEDKWLERAKTLTEDEFIPLVDKAVKGGDGDLLYDRRVILKFYVYETQSKLINDLLDMFAEEKQLKKDDRGRLLEMFFAEHRDCGVDVEDD